MRNIYKGYFNQSDFDANLYTFANSNKSQFQAIPMYTYSQIFTYYYTNQKNNIIIVNYIVAL